MPIANEVVRTFNQFDVNAAMKNRPPGGCLTLPYPPTTNKLYRVVNGRPIISAKGRAYKVTASRIAVASGLTPIDSNVSVTLDVYRPAKRGDLDNTMKCLLDSLRGIAWHDDKQITHIEARRHEDKANPRVVIQIRSVA